MSANGLLLKEVCQNCTQNPLVADVPSGDVANPKSRSTGLKRFLINSCYQFNSISRKPQIPVYGTETAEMESAANFFVGRKPQIPVYGTETPTVVCPEMGT